MLESNLNVYIWTHINNRKFLKSEIYVQLEKKVVISQFLDKI